MEPAKFWLAKYLNPKTKESNFYLLSNEPLKIGDDFVYVDGDDYTKILDPKINHFGIMPLKCVWLFDGNKGHDTFRRTFIYSNSII